MRFMMILMCILLQYMHYNLINICFMLSGPVTGIGMLYFLSRSLCLCYYISKLVFMPKKILRSRFFAVLMTPIKYYLFYYFFSYMIRCFKEKVPEDEKWHTSKEHKHFVDNAVHHVAAFLGSILPTGWDVNIDFTHNKNSKNNGEKKFKTPQQGFVQSPKKSCTEQNEYSAGTFL